MQQGVKWNYDPSEVKKYASMGLTNVQIAACLGVSEKTFQKYKAENPEFSEICELGRALGVKNYAEALLNAAIEKNDVKAITFFLERRAGWKSEEKNTSTDALTFLLAQKYAERNLKKELEDTDSE